MKTKHTNNLQKCSGLFMQLGLVFSLAFTYFLLEYKTEHKDYNPLPNVQDQRQVHQYFNPETIKIERKEIVKEEVEPIEERSKLIDEIEKVENKSDKPETSIILEDDKKVIVDKNITFVDTNEPEELDDDSHLITNVQEVPIYPGCEKMKTREDKRKCFEKKVIKFIGKRFNPDVATNLGLQSGKQNIYIKFLITKSGEIEIVDSRANHKKLLNEGERVVKSLPKMQPGKQSGKPVNVSYLVPISFYVP